MAQLSPLSFSIQIKKEKSRVSVLYIFYIIDIESFHQLCEHKDQVLFLNFFVLINVPVKTINALLSYMAETFNVCSDMGKIWVDANNVRGEKIV